MWSILNTQEAGIIVTFLFCSLFFMWLSTRRADKEFKKKQKKYIIDSATGTTIAARRPKDSISCMGCGRCFKATGLKTKGTLPVVEVEIWECPNCGGRIFVSELS
jgi:DNA-directed RNA polymerase subunit RPC12/RpoP